MVVSGGAGFVLPGCECGAVPIAGRLIGGLVAAGQQADEQTLDEHWFGSAMAPAGGEPSLSLQ